MDLITIQASMSKVMVKCPRPECGYSWKTKTKRDNTSCPKCFYKLNVKSCVK